MRPSMTSVDAQHFERAPPFREVAGDQLGIGHYVADDDARKQSGMKVRLGEPRDEARTKLLVSSRDQLAVKSELLGVHRVGLEEGFDVFDVVSIELRLDDRKWRNLRHKEVGGGDQQHVARSSEPVARWIHGSLTNSIQFGPSPVGYSASLVSAPVSGSIRYEVRVFACRPAASR